MNHNKRSYLRGRKLPLHVYLAYLLVCTLVTTGISFSRYAVTNSSGMSLRVEDFSMTATAYGAATYGTGNALTIDCNSSQTVQSYQFVVSSGSGVSVSYDVVVTLSQALPAGVTMTLDGYSGTAAGTSYTFYNIGSFSPGSSSHMHTLTISADPNVLNDEAVINVTISVQAEQVA